MPIVTVAVPLDPEAVLPLADAKQHLRLNHDAENAVIRACIEAAIATIDGPDGWLGRALGLQTLDLRCSGFPCFSSGGIYLPCEPTRSVVEVKYLDRDSVEQTLDTASYDLEISELVLRPGARWPGTAHSSTSVRIRYLAGYEKTPAPIVAALKLMVGDLFAQRGTMAIGTVTRAQMSLTVESLLGPLRRWI